MRHPRWFFWIVVSIAAAPWERAEAQVSRGYGITNGRTAPGYAAAYRVYRPGYYGAQTVTDYQSLIRAITSLPGWYGPPARPSRPVPPQPTMARDELLDDKGNIHWPSAAPDGPARQAAEAAVRIVAAEHRRSGQAAIRHVVDARNKLDAFAARALPAVKTKSAADEAALERFVVELKKTLATMAVHY